jgi:putative ABC transport system permease protein
MLTEGGLLAFAGTALALLISQWLIPLLPAVLPPGSSFMRYDIRMDSRVAGVAMLTCLATVVLFGLAPALQAARTDLMGVLKGRGFEARRSYAGRNLLVVAQAALSVVLFTVAALLSRSFFNSQRQPLGFDTGKEMLVLFSMDRGPRSRVAANSDDVINRILALPGVKQAAYCRRTPFGPSGAGAAVEVVIPGRTAAAGEEVLRIRYNQVSDAYLAAVGTRLMAE